MIESESQNFWRSFLEVQISIEPTEMKIYTEADQVDETRAKIFDLLDRMSRKKKELNERCVPQSVCAQLEQAIRDTEVVLTSLPLLLGSIHLYLSDGHHQGK